MKAREIADLVSGELVGDETLSVHRLADISTAGKHEISFWEKPSQFETNASVVIVSNEYKSESNRTVIRVSNPKLAFARFAAIFTEDDVTDVGRHESAQISESAEVRALEIGAFVSIGKHTSVGDGCRILHGARIGNNVTIGDSTVIHPNCVIYDGVTIGKHCIIHAGSVIGADGFGYVKDENSEYIKFPQAGTVVIEDDVEIGANTCIDRGSLGSTTIGRGTKIDNLVQIAHNVSIGEHVVIAAQTGISGSTVIESDCVIGGQVGIGDHARVLTGAVIGSQAGILPGKIVRPGIWWGTPVQPLEEYKKQNAQVKGLGRLKNEVRELAEKIERLLDRR